MSWEVILRRDNGRFVKVLEIARSKYAGKQRIAFWLDKYDPTYRVTVERQLARYARPQD